MGDCFITRRGGGSGKLFAAIGVTYPAGSTCTCANGSKTLKAKDTSGQCVFPVPEAGTWIVTATDGTNSASKIVEITTEGQSVKVRLDYKLVFYDKDNGGDNIALTGGFVGSTKRFEGIYGQDSGVKPTITKNDDGSVTFGKLVGGQSGTYVTSEPADLTDVSVIRFKGTVETASDSKDRAGLSGFAVAPTITEMIDEHSAACLFFPKRVKTSYDGTEVFLDVSNVTGLNYIIFGTYANVWITMEKLIAE